jgi:acyl-coenzyme A thioesterase PaaI-like protein
MTTSQEISKDSYRNIEETFNSKSLLGRKFGMTLYFNEDNTAIIDFNAKNAASDFEWDFTPVCMSMLYRAGWSVVARKLTQNVRVVNSDFSIHFIDLSEQTSIRATATLLRTKDNQSFTEMSLYDSQGELLGQATGRYVIQEV